MKEGRDREPGSFGIPRSNGRSRHASKGTKAHGSIGCEPLETEAHTTDSSVEKRPGVDRRSAGIAQASVCSVHAGALTAGLIGIGAGTPSGVLPCRWSEPTTRGAQHRETGAGRPAQTGQGELPRGIPAAKRPKPEAPPRWCEDLPSSAPSGLRDRNREIGGGNAENQASAFQARGWTRCDAYRPVPPTHGGSSSFQSNRARVAVSGAACGARSRHRPSCFGSAREANDIVVRGMSSAWVGVTSHLDRFAPRCDTTE